MSLKNRQKIANVKYGLPKIEEDYEYKMPKSRQIKRAKLAKQLPELKRELVGKKVTVKAGSFYSGVTSKGTAVYQFKKDRNVLVTDVVVSGDDSLSIEFDLRNIRRRVSLKDIRR